MIYITVKHIFIIILKIVSENMPCHRYPWAKNCDSILYNLKLLNH